MKTFEVAGIERSGEYADLVITCQGHRFHTHKMVVCSQSSFFAAALRHSFRVSRKSSPIHVSLKP